MKFPVVIIDNGDKIIDIYKSKTIGSFTKL
ncbi:hypothetical protein CLV62_12569 [Dysgonomonas alginatilytica]|uniref:Uncharacterized protein n=1 Tax=Dysgonomonas alginatilytica TaxID=1605892 RepID=A0A2V3PLZ9_9BACT|nr:hypothetical protein CLV62_12569 [Dysgonomonas alginatilytica]